ncbi:MAG: hypothetical protein Q6353_000070 [Candidatus Sigynarchaeum springense]
MVNQNARGDILEVISPELVDPYGVMLEPEFTATIHDKTFTAVGPEITKHVQNRDDKSWNIRH